MLRLVQVLFSTKDSSDNSSFDLCDSRHFHDTQPKSLEIQTCSVTKRSLCRAKIKQCETSSSDRAFYLMKLQPQFSFWNMTTSHENQELLEMLTQFFTTISVMH